MNRQNTRNGETIIINATNIGFKFNGIGIYSLNILRELTKLKTRLNFIVYLNKSCKEHIAGIKFPENFTLIWVSSIISPDRNFNGHLLRLIYSNFLSFKHRDMLMFNTSQLEINFFRKNQVVTIHDVIPLLFKSYHIKQYPYFKLILRFGLKYAKYVLTPSIHSKELLQKIYNLSEIRIRHIHNGARTDTNENISSIQLIEGKYILYLGRICKMKNISNLLKAFDRVQQKTDHKLVIVGNDEQMLNKEIKSANINPEAVQKIIFLKNLNEEAKNNIMRNSCLFVYPSLYEGFGLPPLEAMANGCPVIVSNNSSLTEVCGDAAFYVNPYNPTEISTAIIKVLTDTTLRKNLIEKGLERSKHFSWADSAAEHFYVIEHVLQHSHFPEKNKHIGFKPVLSSSVNYNIQEAKS
jgi:glycosyltransferase involved in cell wall biosynthesis